MQLVMTVMVRDEADVIEAMILHSLDQGVDHILVTDNGSVDGTRELLAGLAGTGRVHVDDEPVQRKQQGSVVTRMARRAASEFGADWVINADADEFWLPRRGDITLKEAFERYSKEWRSFQVPVRDMTGAPAYAGTGIGRLRWQDHRPVEDLRRSGVLSHSSPDAVHVGDTEIVVGQGNHEVSLPSAGHPADEEGLEVLHLQWRSWSQFRRKVENAGRAYAANPHLTPSPNHHGMRDYRMLQAGTLLASYLLRHPAAGALAAGEETGTFVPDDRLLHLERYTNPDVPFSDHEAIDSLRDHDREVLDEINRLREELSTKELELNAYRNRRSVRIVDQARNITSRFGQ